MSSLFRGAMRAHLSKDWRFHIQQKWARIFDPGPLVVTIDPDGPGWRYFPVRTPPDWKCGGHTVYDGRIPWVLSMMRSRDRLIIPRSIRRAINIDSGAELYVMGQGGYIEAWPADEWDKFRNSVMQPDLPCDEEISRALSNIVLTETGLHS